MSWLPPFIRSARTDLRSAGVFARERWATLLAFALLTTYLTCRFSPLLSGAEFPLLDAWMRARPPSRPDPHIVLVGIDRAAVERHQEERRHTNGACSCAVVCRADIGKAIQRIKAAGAQVLGVDLFFSSTCPVAGHDAALTAALRSPSQTEVVLCAEPDPAPDRVSFLRPFFLTDLAKTDPTRLTIASPLCYNPHGVVRSVPLIQVDSPSRAERDQLEPLILVGHRWPPLSLAVAAAYCGVPCDVPQALRDDLVGCGKYEIPVWPSERIYLLDPMVPRLDGAASNYAMLIDWVGPTGTFPMYSFSAVLHADQQSLETWFRDKLVLLGSAAERQHTPMDRPWSRAPSPLVDQSAERTMSGLEIHANAVDTLLRQRFIRTVPPPVMWLVIFVCALVTTVAFRAFGTVRAIALLLVESALLILVAHLLIERGQWLFLVAPHVAIVFAGSVAAVWGQASASQEARSLARQLETIDSMTTTLVHDLKQPLAAIEALASLVRHQQSKGRVDGSPELLQRIQGQVDRALGDIDAVLTADPHRDITLQKREFDLAAMARDLAVAQGLRSPRHQVQVRAPAEGVPVCGDARYLGRAINNLVDNAIKYWPEGGTVIVEIRPAPGTVVIRVIDGGLGIAPDRQHTVFDRFQRGVPAGVDIPGTGIGLYSVKRIAQAHGGTAEVESTPGVGSTFTIRVPTQPAMGQRIGAR